MPTPKRQVSAASSHTETPHYDRPADQHNPSHYRAGGIEVIDFIEAHDLNFNLGNAVKYVSRAGHKEGEDLAKELGKALWYLKKELHRLGLGVDPRKEAV